MKKMSIVNEPKKVLFKWKYGDKEVSLHVNRYLNNNRLYVGLRSYDKYGAEPFADITVNLMQYSLQPNEAFISGNFSHYLINFIEEYKLGKLLPYTVQSGYGRFAAVSFDLDKLAEFDPEGVARFKAVHNIS